ncbi:unnamed protein product [Mycena citricolor]|uniref:DDE Tnp4 domain-containing protein n=1 Tax=Mycena citricolor TaxID=2018698 RepID=A0AAD2H8C3_9AGAR|nr:unnamed protein product [Mycena citricolor]
MTTILQPSFMRKAVRMPTPEEKAKAKRWVCKHSCKAWKNGCCFVDGTLIPLDERPTWYRPGHFDWKCNYLLNIQIVNLPNLQVIDYGYGHTGSTHDSLAWQTTRLATQHSTLLEEVRSKEEERGGNDIDWDNLDPFIADGMASSEDEDGSDGELRGFSAPVAGDGNTAFE